MNPTLRSLLPLLLGLGAACLLFGWGFARALLLGGGILGTALVAISVHEWAHAAAADALGDPTARRLGRLTLNPAEHFDLFGMVLLPLGLVLLGLPWFGFAKPVPVDFARVRPRRLGTAAVAAAGPAANAVCAAVGALLLNAAGIARADGWTGGLGWTFVSANVGLAVFNLLPLYPLDGGRIASALLPDRARDWIERRDAAIAPLALAALVGGSWAADALFGASLFRAVGGLAGDLLRTLSGGAG